MAQKLASGAVTIDSLHTYVEGNRVNVAFKFGEISDPTQMYASDMFTISNNIAGNGGISVPLGLGEDSKLPVSAQLVGPAFKDRQLLTFARALERGFADAATGAPALSVAPDFAGKGGEL